MQLSKGVLLMKEIRRARLLESQQVFIREVEKCAALWSRTDIHRPLQTPHYARLLLRWSLGSRSLDRRIWWDLSTVRCGVGTSEGNGRDREGEREWERGVEHPAWCTPWGMRMGYTGKGEAQGGGCCVMGATHWEAGGWSPMVMSGWFPSPNTEYPVPT